METSITPIIASREVRVAGAGAPKGNGDVNCMRQTQGLGVAEAGEPKGNGENPFVS